MKTNLRQMKKMFARNKFLWRGYFLTIIQQDVKSGCLSARSGPLFRKKDCFCFKSQKKERKIIIKKGRKSGLLTISLRMVCPQLFGQVIGNLLQQEM